MYTGRLPWPYHTVYILTKGDGMGKMVFKHTDDGWKSLTGGKEVIAGRAYSFEKQAFHDRVLALRPKRSVSERIRELINADVKKWRKGKGKK